MSQIFTNIGYFVAAVLVIYAIWLFREEYLRQKQKNG